MSKSHPLKDPETQIDRPFSIRFIQPSKTRQEFAGETNINTIMKKFEKEGIVTHLNERQGEYGDFTHVLTYSESLSQIAEAQTMFDALPSRIRKAFDNDPVKFVEIASDPLQQHKLVELGLAPAPKKDTKPSATQNPKEAPKSPEKASLPPKDI